MNKALWIARKNYLHSLIKKVSESLGGDEPEFLKAHFEYILEHYPDEHIEKAITCYEEMMDQLRLYPKRQTDE